MDVAEMMDDLGDHGFVDSGTLTKVRVLQDTIWEIEGLRPWPFLETSALLSFDGVEATATNMPADFRAALKVVRVSDGFVLDPITVDDLELAVGGTLTQGGPPRVYYPEGETIRFWPVPPAGSDSIRMRYLRWSAPINSGSAESEILIPKRHHRVIVLGALVRLYDMEDDPELAARFEGHFHTRVEKMAEDLFKKQYDRPEYVRVTDPDSWDY